MGKILSCCSRSSTTQLYQMERSTSTDTRLSEPPPSSHSDNTLEIQRSQSLGQDSLDKFGVVNEGAICNAKLECLIVPSFGKHPPRNVVVKKASSDFLKGVGDDFKIIQRLIDKDYQKELVNVTLMCHFEQVKVAEFTKIIEDRMNDIRLKNTDGQKGNNAYLVHWPRRVWNRQLGVKRWVSRIQGCLHSLHAVLQGAIPLHSD